VRSLLNCGTNYAIFQQPNELIASSKLLCIFYSRKSPSCSLRPNKLTQVPKRTSGPARTTLPPIPGGLGLAHVGGWAQATSGPYVVVKQVSNSPDKSLLSLAKSHCDFKSITQTSSSSDQHQLINALDKRQTKVTQPKGFSQPTESSFQIMTDASLYGTSARLPSRLPMIDTRTSRSLAITGICSARAQVKRRPSVQIR